MNKARRKAIEDIQSKIIELKELIESVCEEEQEAFDNLPESIQYSERGDAMQEAIDNLESACSSCEEVEDYLTDACGY